MRNMRICSMLKGKLRLVLALLIIPFALAVGSVASTTTATVLDAPWSGGGTGTTTVVSDGTSEPAAFYYTYEVECCPSGSWNFNTVASNTRTVVLKYRYTGYHAFFQVRVGLEAVVGTTTYPLVNDGPVNCCTPPSGGFSYTGTVALPVQTGDKYGFELSGSNFDSDGRLNGTLVVDELSSDDCKKGGWESITDTSGAPLFKNQGDCVSFVETGGRNDPGQNLP